MWQVGDISELFFQFDVVKDVNVFKPEDMSEDGKLFFLGFWNTEILNKTKYTFLTGKKRPQHTLKFTKLQ